jgi:hypothetical protein
MHRARTDGGLDEEAMRNLREPRLGKASARDAGLLPVSGSGLLEKDCT